MDIKIFWSEVVRDLSLSLPGHAMNTWIDPIKTTGFSKNEIVLQVPNQFFLEWVESHYKKAIDSSTIKVSLNKIFPRFTINEDDKVFIKKEREEGSGVEQRKRIVKKPTPTNKEYVFDNFVEGSNNQFAKTAAQAVADDPGKQAFNPLIIYGGVGLGKTHLIHSIGNEVLNLSLIHI